MAAVAALARPFCAKRSWRSGSLCWQRHLVQVCAAFPVLGCVEAARYVGAGGRRVVGARICARRRSLFGESDSS